MNNNGPESPNEAEIVLEASLQSVARSLMMQPHGLPYAVIPCRVKLKNEDAWRDPCELRVTDHIDARGTKPELVIYGGDIEALEPSALTLPTSVILKSFETGERGMGNFDPLTLKLSGSGATIVIPACSYFLDTKGETVDEASAKEDGWQEPTGDTMRDRMTVGFVQL